eukprot:TRINITY_DN10392_c0_g1_i5.p1 TRINITY_DN10392_c0_g1~~TRINITY_DN10392_c0_g1_i5.p1  ORF type:complete len:138 (-),score=4.80 TRINITY_DN10392_c0_g1_i5:54-467(-)
MIRTTEETGKPYSLNQNTKDVQSESKPNEESVSVSNDLYWTLDQFYTQRDESGISHHFSKAHQLFLTNEGSMTRTLRQLSQSIIKVNVIEESIYEDIDQFINCSVDIKLTITPPYLVRRTYLTVENTGVAVLYATSM